MSLPPHLGDRTTFISITPSEIVNGVPKKSGYYPQVSGRHRQLFFTQAFPPCALKRGIGHCHKQFRELGVTHRSSRGSWLTTALGIHQDARTALTTVSRSTHEPCPDRRGNPSLP